MFPFADIPLHESKFLAIFWQYLQLRTIEKLTREKSDNAIFFLLMSCCSSSYVVLTDGPGHLTYDEKFYEDCYQKFFSQFSQWYGLKIS